MHVILDLCGGLDARSEQAAFERMWAAGAMPLNIPSFATGLIDDMDSETGNAIMATLARHFGWTAPQNDVHNGGIPQAERAAIDALFERMLAGWQAGDARAFASAFSEHSRFVAFDGTVLSGADEIAAWHAPAFGSQLAGTRLRLKIGSVRRIADGVFTVASEGGIDQGDERVDRTVARSAQTFLLETASGELRVTSFQNTRVRPIGSPASAKAWQAFDESWSRLHDDGN